MTNQLAETEVRETHDQLYSDNPYATPVNIGNGAWDHTLFWIFMKWLGVGILILLVADVILMIRFRDAFFTRQSTVTIIRGMISGEPIGDIEFGVDD